MVNGIRNSLSCRRFLSIKLKPMIFDECYVAFKSNLAKSNVSIIDV